jgi:hypothetical protein
MWQAVVLLECCSKVAQRSFTGYQRLLKGCAKVAQRLCKGCAKIVQRLQIAARALSSSCRDNLKTCSKLLCCSNVAQMSFTGYQRLHKGCAKVVQRLRKVAQRLCKVCKSLLARFAAFFAMI